MCRTLAVVALCLLGMLAISSGAKEVFVVDGSDSIGGWSCGFCYDYWWGPFQAPCYRWIRYCARWRTTGSCNKRRFCMRWVWYIEAYCCSGGILFYFPYHPYYPYPHHHSMYLCYNRYYHGGCGGFLGARSHQPCKYNGLEMCGPSYRLSGSSCVKDTGTSLDRGLKGGAVQLAKNPRILAKSPPANVKSGMLTKAPSGGLGPPSAASIAQ